MNRRSFLGLLFSLPLLRFWQRPKVSNLTKFRYVRAKFNVTGSFAKQECQLQISRDGQYFYDWPSPIEGFTLQIGELKIMATVLATSKRKTKKKK